MAKILVIDDNEAFRDLLVEMLRTCGHSTLSASNGLEALKVFRAEPADLILTDLMMPYDGLATIRILRSEYPNVGIIAMTGGGTHRLDYAKSVGAQVTLTKPFSAATLMSAIAELLPPAAPTVA